MKLKTDAIYRIMNKKINIKFKDNLSISLGKSLSPINSQNTIWFKNFPFNVFACNLYDESH